MADQSLTINTLSCGADKYIQVEYDTLKPAVGEKIFFKNTLNGNKAADIKFFEAGEKDSSPVPGFCTEEGGGTFTVPGIGVNGGLRTCTVADKMGGVYQYRIEAETHITLDPVIIVEPMASSSVSFLQSPGEAGLFAVTALGALAIAAMVSYRIGFNSGTNQRTPG